MSEAKHSSLQDNIQIDASASKLGPILLAAGAATLLAGVGIGVMSGHLDSFFRSYIVAFMYTLAIGLGMFWFVTMQHLTNAKWSVVVRRIPEVFAANIWVIGILALGLIVPMLLAGGHEGSHGGITEVYQWLDSHKVHEDHLLHSKAAYLNKTFFVIRCIIYFAVWTGIGNLYLAKSRKQDETGDVKITSTLLGVSAPSLIGFVLTMTFCSIDFVMSIDASWFSTIFGVYYFAGCVLSAYSVLALSLMWLQSKGFLVNAITAEHYHDIGKMMFAFTIFWTYIAFSQYMLIWYGDIPEETHWYKWRFTGGWRIVTVIMLFCNFIIPFFGLLSRHVKRNKKALAFWAIWILVFRFVDLTWLVKPSGGHPVEVGVVDVLLIAGMVAIYLGATILGLKKGNLVCTKDPRLEDSLAFQNV